MGNSHEQFEVLCYSESFEVLNSSSEVLQRGSDKQNLYGEVALLRSSFSRSSLNYYGAVRSPSSQEQFAGSLKYYVVLQISHHFAGTTLDRFLIGTLFSVKHST